MVDPLAQTAASMDGVAAPAASSGLEAGQLVGMRYRLVDQLGSGAMGEVWRARHEELHTELAVKIARVGEHDRDRLLERFRFEAQVSAQLSRRTRHIVAVYDAGMVQGAPFMAMELVEGESLGDMVERAPLAIERVAEVLDQLADALHVAHDAGIWHRDIKPDNVMVSLSNDGSWLVKLADFGVSKSMKEGLDVDAPKTTTQGMLVGTPHYMSPQQLEGAGPDARGDLWSLAVLVYELLTARMPFEGDTLTHLITSICTREPVKLRDVRPSVGLADPWFDRALAKDPADRFASAREMAQAFRRLLPDDERPLALPPSRPRWPLALVGMLAITAVGGYVLSQRATPPVAESSLTPEPPEITASPEETALAPASATPPSSRSAEATAAPASPPAPPSTTAAPAPPPPPPVKPKPYDPSETF